MAICAQGTRFVLTVFLTQGLDGNSGFKLCLCINVTGSPVLPLDLPFFKITACIFYKYLLDICLCQWKHSFKSTLRTIQCYQNVKDYLKRQFLLFNLINIWFSKICNLFSLGCRFIMFKTEMPSPWPSYKSNLILKDKIPTSQRKWKSPNYHSHFLETPLSELWWGTFQVFSSLQHI